MPWLLNQRALYAAPNCIRHLASHRHGSTVYQTRFHTASAITGRPAFWRSCSEAVIAKAHCALQLVCPSKSCTARRFLVRR